MRHDARRKRLIDNHEAIKVGRRYHAFYRGYQAHLQGLVGNPYKAGSEEYDAWNSGREYAKETGAPGVQSVAANVPVDPVATAAIDSGCHVAPEICVKGQEDCRQDDLPFTKTAQEGCKPSYRKGQDSQGYFTNDSGDLAPLLLDMDMQKNRHKADPHQPKVCHCYLANCVHLVEPKFHNELPTTDPKAFYKVGNGTQQPRHYHQPPLCRFGPGGDFVKDWPGGES